jgi:hypothetical protein
MRRTLAAALLALAGCSGNAVETVRSITYPPDFAKLPESEAKTAMHQIAISVSELNGLLRSEAFPSPEAQQRVVTLLTNMEQASAGIHLLQLRSTHPMLDANIEAFRSDLEQARLAAEASPPNFFLAGSVTGACLHCHRPRP